MLSDKELDQTSDKEYFTANSNVVSIVVLTASSEVSFRSSLIFAWNTAVLDEGIGNRKTSSGKN